MPHRHYAFLPVVLVVAVTLLGGLFNDGTPFTDRGFENVPSLQHLESWLTDLRKAA